jgi:PAS domain S-box-containing protein
MPEDALLNVEAVAQALLYGGAEAIVACDRDGLIRFWNAGAERMFGHSAGDANGRSLDIIIPERLRERHWQGFREVMAGRESRYAEGATLAVPALRKDGTRISVEFTITPITKAGGGILGLAAVMRDVTSRFEEVKMLRRQARDARGG